MAIIALLFAGLFGFSSYKKNQENELSKRLQSAFSSQQRILLNQTDIINTNWLHTLNPLVKDVQGRLLWSTNKQFGLTTFKTLPKITKGQSYHLYLYDLGAKDSNAIEVAIITPTTSGPFETSFEPIIKINSPLKFELILKEEGKSDQPLLFAQP